MEGSKDGACHLKKKYNEASTNLCICSFERAFAAHVHSNASEIYQNKVKHQ